MTSLTYSPGEAPTCGEAIYWGKTRRLVEPQAYGKFVVLDLETGDYETDIADISATLGLLETHPDPVTYAVRVGCRTAYSVGGGVSPSEPRSRDR